jgi:hypothetical protein
VLAAGDPVAATSVEQQGDHGAREVRTQVGADQGRGSPNSVFGVVTIFAVLGIVVGALESQERFAFEQRRLHWVSTQCRKRSFTDSRKFVLATCLLAIPVSAAAHTGPVPERESPVLVGIGAVALIIGRRGRRK